MKEPSVEADKLAHEVIGASIEVHRELGPGYIEGIYEEALCIELELRGLPFERQVSKQVFYKGRRVGEGRLDLVVGGDGSARTQGGRGPRPDSHGPGHFLFEIHPVSHRVAGQLQGHNLEEWPQAHCLVMIMAARSRSFDLQVRQERQGKSPWQLTCS